MVIASPTTQRYTAEEYLALEVESEIRNEYRNGEIVPMTEGTLDSNEILGTPEHNEIIGNLIFLLKASLKRQPYCIFVTDQRLWLPERKLYTYPDTMVTPRPVSLKPGRKDTVMGPILIAEVLSNSTEGYDRGDKFQAYRTIPAFQEYLLIDQYSPHVEQYVKQTENQWLFAEYSGLDAALTLPSISVTISLADLYEAVEF